MNSFGVPSWERIFQPIRRRVLFHDRIVTMGIIVVIMLWYMFEIATLILGWELERLQWWFTTESFPALSPGLFLAIISHAPPPQSTHLLANVIGLWLLAGESEQHMTKLEVGVFFVVTSWLSVLAGTVVLGENTMGASGGVLGFLGFYCVHMFLEHQERLELDRLSSTTASKISFRTYVGVLLVLTPFVLIPYFLGQLVGIIPAGNSDMVGHLIGFLCGMIYGYLRG